MPIKPEGIGGLPEPYVLCYNVSILGGKEMSTFLLDVYEIIDPDPLDDEDDDNE